jgi:hypothetical protein
LENLLSQVSFNELAGLSTLFIPPLGTNIHICMNSFRASLITEWILDLTVLLGLYSSSLYGKPLSSKTGGSELEFIWQQVGRRVRIWRPGEEGGLYLTVATVVRVKIHMARMTIQRVSTEYWLLSVSFFFFFQWFLSNFSSISYPFLNPAGRRV